MDRHRIHIEKPIKESGEHEVLIKLHAEVTAKLVVIVKAKGGEAESQEGEASKGDDKGFKAKVKAKHSK